MRNALLIWDQVGFSLEIYYFPNISEEDINLLEKSDGKYINIDLENIEAIEKVNELLADNWANKKIQTPFVPTEAITHVFICGFML